MPAISELTRQKIKAYLEVFIENKVQDYKRRQVPIFEEAATYLAKQSKPGRLKPFHAAIIPEPIMRINPYGVDRASYRWSIPQKYMPFDSAVVIAQEFWTLVGGPTTFQELLEIYGAVGKEKSKYILDALAFGF